MNLERLDLNQAIVSGKIYKIWSRRDGNVYLRIDNQKKERVTIILPDGQVNGHDVSLKKGDLLQVEGYLKDFAYEDSLSQYFSRSGRKNYLKELPPLRELIASGAGVERYMMAVVPKSLTISDTETENTVRVEGIVISKWHFGDNYCIRMLVFDENAPIETVKENGVVHRSPHSIIAILPETLFKQVHERQRIRIGGSFTERIYHERLKKALEAMKQQDVAAQVPQEVLAFTVSMVQMYINVKSMIAYTR